eukprot:Nk52_evm33s2192 gene=Nk52_evmTU33s2192
METLLPQRTGKDGWVCVYPQYLDKNLTVAKGRRVVKECAVGSPTVEEISTILKVLGLQHEVEPRKMYPRDFLTAGRVKVQMRKDDGTPVRKDIQKRNALWKAIATGIGKIPNRVEKSTSLSSLVEDSPAASSSGATAGGGGGSSKKGKKGKKGRR